MRMNELAARILGWANDRNLIEGSTVEKQNVKLVEEFGEFAAGLARGKVDVQADALGDMMVILIIMGQQTGGSLGDALRMLTEGVVTDYDNAVTKVGSSWVREGISAAFLAQACYIGYLAADLREGANGYETMAISFLQCVSMCFELQLAPAKVLEDVWNIIKDRKGKMVDGVFVKENDAMMATGNNAQ